MDGEIQAVLAGEAAGCVVCGDWLQIMPDLPGRIALVTDPPYGIGFDFSVRRSRGEGNLNWAEGNRDTHDRDWVNVAGDDKPFNPVPFLRFERVILWGAQNYSERLPRSRGWLVWDKLCQKTPSDFGDCELAWTNIDMPVRIHYQLWRGIVREGDENLSREWKYHPCQKPLRLMLWCLSFIDKDLVVVDPYCGSGTTCMAAAILGRRYLGIDICPEYVEIARERLRAVDTGVPVAEARKGQRSLFGETP